MSDPKPQEGEDKPTEGAGTKPAPKHAADPQAGTDPTPDPFEAINARLAAMEQSQTSMMQAITALANQGATNASVQADNGNAPDEEDFPEIDLDSVNRLIGA